MVSDSINIGLIVAYLVILGLTTFRYYRRKLSFRRLLLFIGMSFIWLSHLLLQLTQGGPIPTGTPLNHTLDGLSVVILLTGLYAMYRWWHSPDSESGNYTTNNS